MVAERTLNLAVQGIVKVGDDSRMHFSGDNCLNEQRQLAVVISDSRRTQQRTQIVSLSPGGRAVHVVLRLKVTPGGPASRRLKQHVAHGGISVANEVDLSVESGELNLMQHGQRCTGTVHGEHFV